MEEHGVTVRTPVPGSRTEAWAAWEAYMLDKIKHLSLSRTDGMNKKFVSQVRRSGLALFAVGFYPNRQQVACLDLWTGKTAMVKVSTSPDWVSVEEITKLLNRYKVVEAAVELRELQDEVLVLAAKTVTKDVGSLVRNRITGSLLGLVKAQ